MERGKINGIAWGEHGKIGGNKKTSGANTQLSKSFYKQINDFNPQRHEKLYPSIIKTPMAKQMLE